MLKQFCKLLIMIIIQISVCPLEHNILTLDHLSDGNPDIADGDLHTCADYVCSGFRVSGS